MKKAIILPCIALLGACRAEKNPEGYAAQVDTAQGVGEGQMANNPRVTVQRIAIVKDTIAYEGRRGVYIITDTQTGVEYIGVSGIGINELGEHPVGKSHTEDER